LQVDFSPVDGEEEEYDREDGERTKRLTPKREPSPERFGNVCYFLFTISARHLDRRVIDTSANIHHTKWRKSHEVKVIALVEGNVLIRLMVYFGYCCSRSHSSSREHSSRRHHRDREEVHPRLIHRKGVCYFVLLTCPIWCNWYRSPLNQVNVWVFLGCQRTQPKRIYENSSASMVKFAMFNWCMRNQCITIVHRAWVAFCCF
jgi:hypothetical protein